jgi:phospholipid-translocating ATPase
MSVILEKNNRIFVYCKGADNVILKRLRTQNTKRCKIVNERIEEWSQEGLRTLLFAKREIEKKDY